MYKSDNRQTLLNCKYIKIPSQIVKWTFYLLYAFNAHMLINLGYSYAFSSHSQNFTIPPLLDVFLSPLFSFLALLKKHPISVFLFPPI